jgi:hypothetical protein
MKTDRKVEQWRNTAGFSYNHLAKMLGCSRQYARSLCLDGTSGIAYAVRLLSLAKGELDLTDLLSEEDREALTVEGFLPHPEDVI